MIKKLEAEEEIKQLENRIKELKKDKEPPLFIHIISACACDHTRNY